MKDFVSYLAKALVDNPDAVTVSEETSTGFSNLTLSVGKDDMGKIIGREGRTIKAIRDLVRILAIKSNLRFNLTLTES